MRSVCVVRPFHSVSKYIKGYDVRVSKTWINTSVIEVVVAVVSAVAVIIIIIMLLLLLLLLLSLVTVLFFLVLVLNQRWSPPLRLQVSDGSTLRITCDVRSIAVLFRESIECFPGMASKVFLKPFVAIPAAPFITGMILYFRFHIPRISIHKLLYFSVFSTSFCTTFLSAGISTSVLLLLLLLLLIYWVLKVMRDDFLIYPCLLQKSEEIMANVCRAL